MSTVDPPGLVPPKADPAPSPHVAALRDSLAELIVESQALRTDVRGAERARRRASQISLGLLGLVGLFVGMLMVVSWQNNRLAHQVAETNTRMADCTTPGGKCYEEGRKRTDGAVSAVVRISVLTNQCARLFPEESGPAYDRKLEACVQERLAQPVQTPTPNPSPARPGG